MQRCGGSRRRREGGAVRVKAAENGGGVRQFVPGTSFERDKNNNKRERVKNEERQYQENTRR
jgi:hypothetical protein